MGEAIGLAKRLGTSRLNALVGWRSTSPELAPFCGANIRAGPSRSQEWAPDVARDRDRASRQRVEHRRGRWWRRLRAPDRCPGPAGREGGRPRRSPAPPSVEALPPTPTMISVPRQRRARSGCAGAARRCVECVELTWSETQCGAPPQDSTTTPWSPSPSQPCGDRPPEQ